MSATFGGEELTQPVLFGSVHATSYLCIHIYLLLFMHSLLKRKCILFHMY